MQTVCVILIPQPGIEPMPPALEAESLDHWTKGMTLNLFHKEKNPICSRPFPPD